MPAGLALLRAACGDDLTRVAPALRYLELGSAPMTTLDKKALAARLPGVRLWMHYGLTEASRSAFLRLDDPDAALESVGEGNPGNGVDCPGTARFGEHHPCTWANGDPRLLARRRANRKPAGA